MKKHIGMIVLATLVVLALLTYTVTYQVDEHEDIVLIKRFGKVVKIQKGADDAGLHFKKPWPIEKIVRYEARRDVFEGAYSEISTGDGHPILVSLFCMWEVADPEKLLQKHQTVENTRDALRIKLRNHKSNVIGRHEMKDFINTDPTQMKLKKIESEVLALLKNDVEDAWGVKITMVGFRAFGLTEEVSKAVIEAQKQDREEFVKAYQAEGEADALAITERAKSAKGQIMEFARRKA